MRAVLVFLVVVAVGLPTGACVASGGTWTAGSPKAFKDVAKGDGFHPILVNTPGRHGFAPQKSQEPDTPIVTVPQANARRLRH